MIKVKILKRNGKSVGFDISCHSGYAENGKDIVCAAVSSAVGFCETLLNDSLGAKASVTVQPDTARIALSLSGNGDVDLQIKILSALERHLLGIAEEYPKYIEVLEVQSNA